jgi:hypothetical protein
MHPDLPAEFPPPSGVAPRPGAGSGRAEERS